MFLLTCAILTLFIGLRDEVGGDWFNYLPVFRYVSTLDLASVLEFRDPGYYVLNWLAAEIGWEIYAVNFACAVILMVGVFRFCRSLPNQWLALLVAIPYMLNIVGMGYTRQAVALGLAMFGLVSLGKGRTLPFVACVMLGAVFHSSAVLLIPIAGVASSRRRVWTVLWVVAAFALAYFVLLQPEADNLWSNYVTAEMESHGAIQRVLMNVVAAIPLLLYPKRLVSDPQERWLWMIFSSLAIACLPLVFLASTAVDRMALYLLPLQLFVFSRFPNITQKKNVRTAIVIGLVLYYAAVQFVWLNFALKRESWVPYHFMPMFD